MYWSKWFAVRGKVRTRRPDRRPRRQGFVLTVGEQLQVIRTNLG